MPVDRLERLAGGVGARLLRRYVRTAGDLRDAGRLIHDLQVACGREQSRRWEAGRGGGERR